MAFVVYIKRECPHSQQALKLLKRHKLEHNVYDVNDVGGISYVIDELKKNKNLPRNCSHRTVPIVFGPDGRFIGGCDSLTSYLANK